MRIITMVKSIPVCHRLKSADNVYDRKKRLTMSHGKSGSSPLATQSMFASYSVCTTVAIVTITWLLKFVDEVGSTVFHRSSLRGFTTRRTISSKADLPDNFTIFHCRMSTIQPAWPLCTTSVCWHTCCWHFGSCSSHKTIPSLRELVVAQF